jgi:exodeoxyribonuclease VII small subunit
MADETYGFETARVRLEEIAAQARRKDTSLEKSLDLLEEGVRLANLCTEQIDQTQWKSATGQVPAETGDASLPVEGDGVEGEACGVEPAGAEAEGDIPAEDPHAATSDAPAEDPDVEA